MTRTAASQPFSQAPLLVTHLGTGLLVAGAAAIAWEPAQWLAGTWYRDGYEGIGWIACGLTAAIAAWSATSPRLTTATADHRNTCLLLLATAVLRLTAQLLAINVIGALLLAVDVFALARLAGLHQRERPVSPFWLAVLFAFSLPLEPIAQRLVGYDLQHLSAAVACAVLSPIYDSLTCQGVRLHIDGTDVLVDLPCSGAELLSLSGLVLACINARFSPPPLWGLAGAFTALGLALTANGVRIAVLAAGIAHRDALPFFVMDPVPHTLLGLAAVALTAAALWTLAGFYPPAPASPRPVTATGSLSAGGRISFALLFFPLALAIGAVRPQPVDASVPALPPELPQVAATFSRAPMPLTPQEQRYFTRFGGGAARAAYGPFGLLLVTTASPLRHLHDPTICLAGMGYRVQLLGTDHTTTSTVYQASDPDNGNDAFLVRVTYVSDTGQLASSIAEVVWHWLRTPGTSWTMVQRIAPLALATHPTAAAEFDNAVRRAFNLYPVEGGRS